MKKVNPNVIIQQKRRLETTEILICRRILSKQWGKYMRNKEFLKNMGNKETLQKLCQKDNAGIPVIYNKDKGIGDLKFIKHLKLLHIGKYRLAYITNL